MNIDDLIAASQIAYDIRCMVSSVAMVHNMRAYACVAYRDGWNDAIDSIDCAAKEAGLPLILDMPRRIPPPHDQFYTFDEAAQEAVKEVVRSGPSHIDSAALINLHAAAFRRGWDAAMEAFRLMQAANDAP